MYLAITLHVAGLAVKEIDQEMSIGLEATQR